MQRIIFLIILLSNFALKNEQAVDVTRVYLNAIGVGVHMVFLIPLLYSHGLIMTLHAPIVILSFQTFVFNNLNKFSGGQMMSFLGQQTVIVVGVVVLSQSWIYTSISLFVALACNCVFFWVRLNYYMGVLLPQLILFLLILMYIAYFCELRAKYQFLQNRKNKRMKNEFRHMLEVVPEAIFLYEPNSKRLLMANTELQRLVKKYSAQFASYPISQEVQPIPTF